MSLTTWEDGEFIGERLHYVHVHVLNRPDSWNYTFDNNFALDFFKSFPAHKLLTHPAPVECCAWCASVVAPNCCISLDQVRVAKNGCDLCALLLRQAEPYCTDSKLNPYIVRDRWWLKVGSSGPRILRLYSDSECSDGTGQDYPISFPVLPEAESPARFALLRAWLGWCDESHDCNKHNARSTAVLPTRLLYVGDPDPDVLRLYCPNENDRVKYVALSHCWGKLTEEEKRRFCTTDNNIKARLEMFRVSEQPKTFQEAVQVTRELGIQYLWIDSLCIIQWNDKDWKHEANRMEGVFASAYCTIAATSAVDSKAGFLKRNVRSENVYVQDPSGRRFYVCADTEESNNHVDIDDFDNHVEKAPLNRRAWVLQERVLSRRTIHFSDKQMFWECGEGVYCETLTKLGSSFRRKFFMLDPNFPDRLLQSRREPTIDFIHFLFKEYSERCLTEETDRCVAISGLGACIARAIKCENRYGVLQQYLHRNLLWQASDKKLKQIAYEGQCVPSWSWMAYNGDIQFMDISFGKVDWIQNLEFDKERALVADVGEFRDCEMKPDGKHYAVLDFNRIKRGWIQYDVEEGEDLCKERCVVAGRKSNRDVNGSAVEYYILVVRPTNIRDEYKRVGIGLIQSAYVVRQRLNVRVV